MKKIIENIKKYPKAYIIALIISMVLGVTSFLLFYFLGNRNIISLLNGTGVTGMILLGVAGLCIVSRFGAFDTLSYGFKQMFSSWFAKQANKYNDMAEYKEEKNRARENGSYYYLSIIVVAILFIIAYIILEIYKSVNYNF